jgi:hypothetical protein
MGIPFAHTESTCGIKHFKSYRWPCCTWNELEAVRGYYFGVISDRSEELRAADESNLITAGVGDTDTDQAAHFQLRPISSHKIEHNSSTLLSDNVFDGSDLIVRLFDFAGQDVFSCLYSYILTRHGVYIVVLDMNWLNVSSSDLYTAVEYLSY